jgi:hypothetical protein
MIPHKLTARLNHTFSPVLFAGSDSAIYCEWAEAGREGDAEKGRAGPEGGRSAPYEGYLMRVTDGGLCGRDGYNYTLNGVIL